MLPLCQVSLSQNQCEIKCFRSDFPLSKSFLHLWIQVFFFFFCSSASLGFFEATHMEM